MADSEDRSTDARTGALYAGPPSEFVAARDALARELRDAGDREAAARVRELRRPSRLAAELNRMAHERPDDVAALIDAALALEQAQARVLDGSGSADALREAEEAEARALAALASDPATRAALRMAARSERERETLRAGRLSRDPEPEAGGLFGAGPAVPRAARTAPPRSPATAPAPAPPGDAEGDGERALAQARGLLEMAETAERTAADRLAEAEEEAARAEDERARAAEARDEARAALERAREAVQGAERDLAGREREAREAAAAREKAAAAAREAEGLREAAERAVEAARRDG
jgi:hypothetical protein